MLISELARALNVSVQAIYKKINKTLKDELLPHIKTVNGQKIIDEQGIEIIKNSLDLNSVSIKNEDNNVLNPSELVLTLKENEGLKEQIKTLKDSNNAIEGVLNQFKTVQNEEVLFLREQNKTLLEKVGQQSDQIAELAEKLTELNRNQQLLLNQEQQKNTLLLSDERTQGISEDSATEQKSKQGFLQRIFKKNR
jgi:hypothetical protein